MVIIRTLGAIIAFLLLAGKVNSQEVTVNGHVRDENNGEVLIGVNVYLKGTSIGTASNSYGFYSLTFSEGRQTVVFSYTGYKSKEFDLELESDTTLNVELVPQAENIEEVVVSGRKKDENVRSTEMSVEKLNSRTIEKIPVLMGEADMLKTLQLTPGVKSMGSMSTGMSIRGGGRDQNLLLLDEAPVYSAEHLSGLFSVFNNDAVKNTKLYKANIPPRYGGRLSSLIDIRMKDGNSREFAGSGGIGLISSRLTLEGPIVEDKASFIVSGRRTYTDLAVDLFKEISKDDDIQDFPLYFYDLNMKANYRLDDNNRLYASGYFGRDKFSYELGEDINSGFDWGNYTTTLRWNHVFNQKLFSNFTLLTSNYDYLLENQFSAKDEESSYSFEYDAFVKDYSLKMDFGYYLNDLNTIRFGMQSTFHDFNLGDVRGQQGSQEFETALPKSKSIESGIYLSNEQEIGENWSFNYGLRYSLFQNIGKATVNVVDDNYNVTGEKKYDEGEIYQTYQNLEPRFAMTYVLSDDQSIKASYSRTSQYIFIASNSRRGNPLDVWMSANPNIKPQVGDQYSTGYYRNFFDNKIETSLDVYYKDMRNQVAFKAFAEPQFNPDIEEDLRVGKGRAYGAELMIRKPKGRLSGWISYSYSTSELKIKDIQHKGWYPSPFDRPHDLDIVAMYDLTSRISISANWSYKTGRPLNAPAARYEYGGVIAPYYSGRNQDRMPDYHQLDLNVTIKGKEKSKQLINGEWVISVNNAYARKNADALFFQQKENNSYETNARKVSYYTIFPSISYNFKF
ncbi:MAG: TonB-dependent receptor [Bacteroidota bacterium]